MAHEAGRQMRVERIVAVLHPRLPLGTQIEALAKHARALDAELVGLFIEDVDMLRFAAMPFACEIGTASALKRSISVEAVERYMAARAVEMREALGQVLDRTSVSWTFRIARGTVVEQLLAAGVEREVAALLLLPGARIELSPVIIARSELECFQRKAREMNEQPILLLPK
jgi:hypothetical protein